MAVKSKPVASPLAVVDLTLEPKEAYMVLDLIYETAGLYPLEATKSLIEYIEGRMVDVNLPLTQEEYEGKPESPEFEERKRVVLSFFDEETTDDYTEEEYCD